MNKKSSKVVLSREEFFELVWEYPISEIVTKYRTYASDIKKLCKKMDVPMPDAGYWTMKRTGKLFPRKELPKSNCKKKFVKLDINNIETPIIADPTDLQVLTNVMYQSLGDTLKMPQQHDDLHYLVVKTKIHLQDRKLAMGLVKASIHFLDIKTSSDNLETCIGFFDCLIKGLEKRGHKIGIQSKIGSRGTYAMVDGESIRLGITEKTQKEIHFTSDKSRTSYFGASIPLNIFKVRIGFEEWVVSGIELEQMLPMFLARIEMEAQAMKKRRGEPSRDSYIEIEKAKSLQCKTELDEFKSLVKKAKRWERAALLREYIVHLSHSGKVDPDYVGWAKNKIDWYDPSVEKEDEIFEYVDRNRLKIKAIDGKSTA